MDEFSKSDSVSSNMEPPNSSSIMLRFFLRGMVTNRVFESEWYLKNLSIQWD